MHTLHALLVWWLSLRDVSVDFTPAFSSAFPVLLFDKWNYGAIPFTNIIYL